MEIIKDNQKEWKNKYGKRKTKKVNSSYLRKRWSW
jgi:hypothetical protein